MELDDTDDAMYAHSISKQLMFSIHGLSVNCSCHAVMLWSIADCSMIVRTKQCNIVKGIAS